MDHPHVTGRHRPAQRAAELIDPQDAMGGAGVGNRCHRSDDVGHRFAAINRRSCLFQLLLALRLPPARKPWMSEPAQMGVFDAVALALALYARGRTARDARSITFEVPILSPLNGTDTAD